MVFWADGCPGLVTFLADQITLRARFSFGCIGVVQSKLGVPEYTEKRVPHAPEG